MRKKIFILLSLIVPLFVYSQDNNNWEIKKGEVLKYKVAFNSGLTGDVKGGEATMSVSSKTTIINGNEAYIATLIGGTTGVIEWFYKVEDKYQTYIETQNNVPLLFKQSIKENDYTKHDEVSFYPSQHIAKHNGQNIAIPNNTQDFLSVIYYVRGLDMTKLKKGGTFSVPYFADDKVSYFTIVYQGTEQITTRKLGKIMCYAFKPKLPSGKMFKDQYPATLWISADNRRLPVLVDAKMKVGKMRMVLTSYSNVQ